MLDIKFEIKDSKGVISELVNGWAKELNIISWNEKEPKYDIREWDYAHKKTGNGISLTLVELKKLKDILNNIEL